MKCYKRIQIHDIWKDCLWEKDFLRPYYPFFFLDLMQYQLLFYGKFKSNCITGCPLQIWITAKLNEMQFCKYKQRTFFTFNHRLHSERKTLVRSKKSWNISLESCDFQNRAPTWEHWGKRGHKLNTAYFMNSRLEIKPMCTSSLLLSKNNASVSFQR